MNALSLIHRLKSLGKSLLIGSALLLPLGQQAAAQTFTNAMVDYGDGSSIPFGVMRTHTDGSVYALWRDGGNNATTGVASEYKLIKWNETGGAWGAPIGSIVFNNIPGLLAGSTPGDLVDLAIDSSGGFHVLLGMSFSTPTAGNGVVYAYSATGASNSWSYSPVAIYTGDNNSPAYPSIELDASNNPHVFLLQRNVTSVTPPPFTARNYTVWYYTRSGGTWSGQQVYTLNGGSGASNNEINEISAVLDSNGKAHILLSPELNGDNKKNITYATNASGSWVTQVIVPTLAITQTMDMDLVIDSNDKLHAIYSPITDRIVHYLTNRSGSWVDTAINNSALSGRLGATNSRGLSITPGNDLFFVYNSSPTSANEGNVSYGYLPAATGNSWQTGSVMNGNFRTADRIATAITGSGRALALFEHFTDPKGTGSPNNLAPPNTNSRQLQFATAQFTPTLPADTTAPDTTISAGPSGNTNDNTPTFNFSGTDNVAVTSYEVQIDSGGYATATSPHTTGTLAAGSHTFYVRAKDAAGNTDATPASRTFFVDTAAPDTTITATPTSLSNSTSANFSFTGNDGSGSGIASFQLKLDTGSFASATSPATLTGLSQGSHTVEIRATDNAGNVDATPATFTWTVDTSPPAAPVTNTPVNGSRIGSTTPTYSGTAEGNSTVTVSVDGSSIGTTTASAGGLWTLTQPTALSQASHTVRATATDAAGNTSPNSNTNTFTVDTTPPAAPVTVTPANGSTTGTTPSVTGTAEANSTVTVVLDGSSIGTTTADAGGNWTKATTALADGSHTVKSRAADVAGNVGPDSNTNTFTVDGTPPPAPVVTAPTNSSRTNDSTPTFTGTAENGSLVSVIIDGTTAGTATSIGGVWSFTSGTLADSAHTVRATATDVAGNVSPSSSTINFTVDTTAPPAPVVSSPDGDRIGDSTPLITGSAESNATILIYIDGAYAGTTNANVGGNWTYTVTSTLAEEAHTVKATATDSVGNVSPDSVINTFYVDTTPPAAPVVVAPDDGSRTTNNTPTLHGTTEPYSTVYVTLTGPTPLTGSTSAGQNGVWIYPINTARADGSYSVTVYAKDGVQNTGPDSNTNTFTVDTTAPTVALSTAAPDPAPLSGFTVTAQFSEAVTDFSSADLVVSGASVNDFTIVDPSTYTFFVTPNAPGVTVTVDIAASAGNDLAGNASTAATQFTKTVIDRAVSIAANVSSVIEGNGDSILNYGFTVSRTGGTVGPVTISYAVTGSGAEPANAADFLGGTLPSGTVTIADGQASASVTLNIARDLIVEADETFTVTLSSPDNGYVLDTASATGSITNDDSATLSVAKLNDGAEYPKVDGKFRITLTAPASAPTLVGYTLGGTASAGTDYTAPVGTATVTAGSTFVDVTIPVVTDYVIEGAEMVVIQLGPISSALPPGITIGTSSSASLTITDNVPTAIVVNAGTPQSAVVGTAFSTPFSVRVNDALGNPLQGASVVFFEPESTATGTFAGIPTVTSNASGIATAPVFTAGTTTGSYTLTVLDSSMLLSASFSLTNTPAAANNFLVSIPATATAGAPVTATVTARDAYNNTATNYTGSVHLTSSDAAATLGANATLTNGVGTFSVTFITGGNQTVTATDTVTSAVTGISNATAVTAQADLAVTVTESPDPVQANANVTYTLTVTNNGPSFAENVSFGLQLPAGVTFVSATRTVQGGWGDGFITGVDSPAIGATGTVTITASKIETYERYDIVGKVGYVGNGTILSATGTASAATMDPNSANNSATATTTVAAAQEIALHNGDSTIAAPITDGQVTAINFGTTTVNNPVTRSFTIANTGNDTLAVSSIGLPSGFSLVSAFSPQQIAPTAAFTFAVRYDADAIGTASGEIVIGNNDADEAPFNFPITATRENVAPVAVLQNLTIEEDEVKAIVLTGNDADDHPLTFGIVDAPLHGSLTGTPPSVTYTPNADYYGDDVFTFTVNDGTTDSTEVEINLTITPVNDAPKVVGTGIPDQIQIRPDVPDTIDLAPYFSDAETASANLTYTVVAPAEAQAVVIGSSLQINGSVAGAFDITVTAADPDALNVGDTFTLTVKRVPQLAGNGVPPTLVSPSEPTFDLDLAGYFIDGDGDPLGYAITNNTDPGVFTATISGSTVTITPVTPGVASLTIRVTDSDGNFIDHTFEVTIDDPIPDAIPTVTSPPKLNRQTGLYEITLTAVNNNQFNVPGFRFRVTSVLPTGTRLFNSTAAPGSSEAYLDVLTVLTPGQSITVVLEFYSATRNFAGFEPTIIAEPLPEGTNNAGTGEGMAVNRFVNLPDGSKLIEFSSIAGRWYEIEYSSDMVTWKRSLVPVQAGANFTQWIDRGAPYTESHPSTVPSRFYRVSEILPD